jgi:urea transport system substrate-binding protein
MSGPGDPLRVGGELSSDAIFPLPPGARAYPFLRPPQRPDELGRLGDYRVLRAIGTGGMGVVFEAEDTVLSRTVALKVLRPEAAADPDSRERFLREARAAAGLCSDHVVAIYRVGEDGGTPYMAVQLLHGESLQERLERTPRLGLATALTVARQAAAGLAAAHAAGLLHRDVKPANIWLESDGPGGPFKRVRILDFGLARRIKGEESLTATGFVVGTPSYMAPEQADGRETDDRADLFSLGAVMYTMLTGEQPFPGSSTMAVLMSLANHTPPPVVEKNPDVPTLLSDLVGRLLAKDPAKRPASAAAVVAALDGVLAVLPAHAPTPPPSPRSVPRTGETPGPSAAVTVRTAEATATERPLQGPMRWVTILVGSGLVGLLLAAVGLRMFAPKTPLAGPVGEPIRVGVLHSQTGTMAVSELPIIDATVLAVEELNQAGGVLGRPVVPVVADGASDPDRFRAEAERLVKQERVAAIFGCQTSPSRKAVKMVVERDNGLLFFPASYEGLEQSPRIVYVGSAPNQKFLPALEYLIDKLGRTRIFVVGSDLVSPRAATEVVRDHLKKYRPRVDIVGARFLPLGSRDVGPVLDAIAAAKPDAVLNILNGSSNFAFYREFHARGWRADTLPTLSISLTEHDLRGVDTGPMAGDLLAANYFEALDRAENKAFIRKVKERFGAERVVTDNMVAAYTAVHLWAKAVAAAGTPDPEAVTKAVQGVEFEGPGGLIRIDPENRHSWRPWRVGQIQADGTVKVVADSVTGVRADPYPDTRTRAEWERLLNDLFVGWDGRWQAPPRP